MAEREEDGRPSASSILELHKGDKVIVLAKLVTKGSGGRGDGQTGIGGGKDIRVGGWMMSGAVTGVSGHAVVCVWLL